MAASNAPDKTGSTGSQKRTDMRITRTKKAIRSAFTDMICEMDYEQITIKELTERAGVNRKTFYLHYDSLDDLLREMQNEMSSRFMDRIKDLKPPYDMDKITRAFFLSMEESGRFGERLACSGNYQYINRRMVANIMRNTWKAENSRAENQYIQNIVMAYVSQSTLAVYRQWVADKKRIPLEDIIQITITLVCNGLDAWLRQEGKSHS
ncbi:MAG: TetR/AcrR family transcriptional regulator [Oscillospiraceae bacterium]|jgi:AcrR family transcriptional regulator